jgi:hypothetical protein
MGGQGIFGKRMDDGHCESGFHGQVPKELSPRIPCFHLIFWMIHWNDSPNQSPSVFICSSTIRFILKKIPFLCLYIKEDAPIETGSPLKTIFTHPIRLHPWI